MTRTRKTAAPKETKEKPIEEYGFFQSIIAIPAVEAVYLYGSRARGDHDARSDLDLAVYCPGIADAQWKEIERAAEEADTLLQVEVTRLDGLPPGTFRQEIERCKQLLWLRMSEEENAIANLKLELKTWQRYQKHFAEKTDAKSFALMFDHAVTTLRTSLKLTGLHAHTPLSVLKEAFAEGWIVNRPLWEQMVRDRSDEGEKDIGKRLPLYAAEMPVVFSTLRGGLKKLGMVD